MRGNVAARRTGERRPDDGCHGAAEEDPDAHEKARRGHFTLRLVEATTGIEPVYAVLQTIGPTLAYPRLSVILVR